MFLIYYSSMWPSIEDIGKFSPLSVINMFNTYRYVIGKNNVHSVSSYYAVLPFYDVNCLCSRGGHERGREATHTSLSMFDLYGIKTL